MIAALVGALVAACGGTAERTDEGAGGSGASASNGSTGNAGTGASGASGSTGGAGTSGGTGGATSFAACNAPGQCLLAEPGCCGSCGEISLPQVEPINASSAQAFYDATCDEPEPVGCPDCAGFRDPAMFAWCDVDHCVEALVQHHPVSECTSSSQCILRAGTDCCEWCGDVPFEQLIAVSTNASPSLQQLVCPADSACPPCAPVYPQDVVAECIDGRCEVVGLL